MRKKTWKSNAIDYHREFMKQERTGKGSVQGKGRIVHQCMFYFYENNKKSSKKELERTKTRIRRKRNILYFSFLDSSIFLLILIFVIETSSSFSEDYLLFS